MDDYPDRASASLLQAIGHLQRERHGAPITRIDALARVAEIPFGQLARLIATGILAGYIEEDEDGALGLTEAGRCWWSRRQRLPACLDK